MVVPGIENFINIKQEKIPLTPSRFLGDQGEVFLEIGFGRGEFLESIAKQHFEAAFIGIEMSLTSVRKMLKRLHRANLTNARVLLADASFTIRRCLEQGCLAGIYMNFPCPWPKKKHSKHRLTGSLFIQGLACVLKDGGFFQVLSDSQEFVEELRRSLSDSGFFDEPDVVRNLGTRIGTKYEMKWRAQNRDIYRLISFKKSTPDSCETLRGDEMPHMKIPKDAFSLSILRKATKHPLVKEHITIIFKTIYVAEEKREFLIDTVTSDDGYEQRFFVKVVEGEKDVLIKLFSSGLPFRTEAVKSSVTELGKLLLNTNSSGSSE